MNWRSVVALLILGFAGGAAGFAWLSSEGSLPWAERKPNVPVLADQPDPPLPAPAFATPTVVQPSASQAEAMLLVVRVRNAIAAGKPLGDLGSRLQVTFGQAQPQALAAIANGARQPVSNAELLDGFEAIAPKLGRPEGSFWDRAQFELRTLFVLRSGDARPNANSMRIERIRAMIVAGDIAEAAQAVRAMPGAAFATDWLTSANRAIAVHRALDALNQAVAMPAPPLAPPPLLMPPASAPVQPADANEL